MTHEVILTGLIGFGRAARVFHTPVIKTIPELRVTRIVERHRTESPDYFPGITVVRDPEALLEDKEIALVIITTPNDTHYDLARQALMAGKHVVVEKPFTTCTEHAQNLIDLAAEKNRMINVFQNRRWDGDFLTVKKIVAENVLGRLVAFESHFDRFRHTIKAGSWREKQGEGSGILFDLGPHLIDQALVLFGPPHMITADIRIQRDQAVTDDYFELILDYRQVKVTLKAGMLVRGTAPRFLLNGTKGSYVKCGLDPQEEALARGRSPLAPDWGKEPEERWGTLDTQMNGLHVTGKIEPEAGNYRKYYLNVVDAIKGRARPAVSGEEMVQTIRIIESAFESNEKKYSIPFSAS